MSKKGLVSLFGPDGTGKTTQAKYIVKNLRERNLRAVYWKSPSFNWVRESMRVIGDDQNGGDVYSDAVLFASAHRLEQYLIRGMFEGNVHPDFLKDKGVREILEGQENHLPAEVIVGQRGVIDYFSFLMAEGMSIKEIEKLLNPDNSWKGHNYMPGQFITPDVLIYLECDPEIAMSRIPREDKWEEVPFLQRLVQTYETLLGKMPKMFGNSEVIRINSEPRIEQVQKEIDEKVLPYLVKQFSP